MMQQVAQTNRPNIPDETALALTTIGALNWGLIGLFSFDLVARLFGRRTLASRLVYTLVGGAGVYSLYYLYKTISSQQTQAEYLPAERKIA